MKYLFFVFTIFFTIVACKKSATNGGGTVIPPPNPPVNVITPLFTLPAGWKYNATLSAGFPNTVQVYAFDSIWAGRPTKAFCLAYDSRSTTIDFKPVMAATAKKTSEFYNAETGTVYGVINGGYFGGNQSYSLVKYNNAVSSANIKVLNRDLAGVSTPYYPTRAVLGVSNTGVPSAAWVYSIGTGNDNIYSYPIVSPNLLNVAPQALPSSTFPAGGSAWATTSAIGGSPMLLYNGVVNITDAAELISINNTTSRPRSSIGYNANGVVCVVAVEGDNTSGGYVGMNLNELANMMQSLTCTNAINLDGGGSSSLVIKNQLTIRPGDAGGIERPVVSALVIKQK
jgi:hypothetical protein